MKNNIVDKNKVEAILNSAFPAKSGIKLEIVQKIKKGVDYLYEVVMFKQNEYVGSFRLPISAIMKLKERIGNK